eukprot:CAMPEP_0197292878 /NCGR_PEP_ID=MMETSP0890-20130614/25606_1 /TAXON_ID=44058 ORGANISM="Aureoumbra lagunensis, Strain CCMP1510" /NCGR_SAMPLE_ID=MMETSP0890 /ASSEMBLY_ACC=CAM_ASM_000533 /LENGTH=155 /DNA_ID=CAMNT_0042767143 /DNA_START=24 /DNA_END=491 /DNA_ORIENTATION=+
MLDAASNELDEDFIRIEGNRLPTNDIIGLRHIVQNSADFAPIPYWQLLTAATFEIPIFNDNDGGEAVLLAHEEKIQAELREIRETKAPVPLGVKSRTHDRLGDDDDATASEDEDGSHDDDDDDFVDDDDEDDYDEMDDQSIEIDDDDDDDDEYMP